MRSPSLPNRFKWFAILVGLLIPFVGTASIKDYPFRVENLQSGRSHAIVAKNDGQAPITVRISLSGENIATDRSFPATIVVPPRSQVQIANIFGANPQLGYQFRTNYSHNYGDINAAPLPDINYRLPFQDGLTFQIGQAYGGRITTHNSPDSEYAVDITMPERTPIVAARSGTVIDISNWHLYAAKDPIYLDKANSVTILHDDGTMAEYAHLAAAQSPVFIGKRVNLGDLIGYSGNTGYSSGPHLHFVVAKATVRPDGVVDKVSIPIIFYAFKPSVQFRPEQGTLVSANYDTPQVRLDLQAQIQQQPGRAPIPSSAIHIEAVETWKPDSVVSIKSKTGTDQQTIQISIDRNWLICSGVAALIILLLILSRQSRSRKQYTYRLEPTFDELKGKDRN